jgi:hypothetical protein
MKATAVLLSVDMMQRTVVARFFDGPHASAECAQAVEAEQLSRPHLMNVAIGLERFEDSGEENGGRKGVICAG